MYNPLKLPLGWDGKPIPYWLYKLHGLNQVCHPPGLSHLELENHCQLPSSRQSTVAYVEENARTPVLKAHSGQCRLEL